MSLGSFFKKISNPLNVFDPAGSTIRAINGAPTTGRTMLDPSGRLLSGSQATQAPAAITPYTSHLSPGAQALRDQIMARRQQRLNPVPTTPAPAPIRTPQPVMSAPMVAPGMSALQVNPSIGNQNFGPMASYKDGGKVKRGAAKKSYGYADGGKVFVRKPNGKPY